MADDHRNQPKAEHIEWFLTFAFGNRIALTVDSVNIEATDASALPTHSRSSWGPHSISLLQKSVCPVIPPYCLLASELTVSNKAE